jgi:leader peptidase (prepilin peptidase)/N-methyltransferase
MLVYYWLFLVFVLGVVVGSFLNVAIARLPLEKSMLWPGSRCGQCLQRIRWYDNIPLVSYLWLRGRCRACGTAFSMRYFWVELCTGLGFVGLFYAEMILNVHHWPRLNMFGIRLGFYPWQWWIGYCFHAIFFSFLMVASVTDLKGREIPLSLTITGAIVGLVGAVCMPWPWPHDAGQFQPAVANANAMGALGVNPWMMGMVKEGVYPWPMWGPPPAWLPPGQWQMGLATGLAGMLAGTLMLRTIGFLASKGLGKEALGLGDADLMMMAGCFLGWQPIVVAFFVSVGPALVFGLFQLIIKRENELPFGPSLAAGLLIAMLGWHWIGPFVQPLLFWAEALLFMAAFAAVFMFAATFLMRLARRSSEPESRPESGK